MRLERTNNIEAQGEFSMATAGDVVKQFYDAAIARDLAKARACLHDNLVFVGLFETYRNADDYIAAFTGLLQVTGRGRRPGGGVAQDQERQDCACRIGL